MKKTITKVAAAVFLFFGAAQFAGGQCAPLWDTSFAFPGINDGSSGIRCSVIFDDGNGPALFVAGQFQSIGGTVAQSIAKTYDGVHWQKLGDALLYSSAQPFPGVQIEDMRAFDPDGAGPQAAVLVVGGYFELANNGATTVNNVAAWNGTSWTAFGNGLPNAGFYGVRSLEVFDSGSGPQLYAAGDFPLVGLPSANIAMWNGTTWVSLGSTGTNSGGQVYDLHVHNDGSGPALYVAGYFDFIVGVSNSRCIARWNGSAWSNVGGGSPAAAFETYPTLCSLDVDGPGGAPSRLYSFACSGRMDLWSGSAWTSINAPQLAMCTGSAIAATVFDAGSGPAIYHAAANIGMSGQHLSRFDGTTFTTMGDGNLGITSLCVNTLNAPPSLFVASGSGTATVPAAGMINFDFSLGNYTVFAPTGGPSGPFADTGTLRRAAVSDLTTFDLDGPGPQSPSTIAIGDFTAMGSVAIGGIGAHNGTTWSNVGRAGIPAALSLSTVRAHQVGGVEALIATAYTNYDLVGAQNASVFKYNAGSWDMMGTPLGFTNIEGSQGYIHGMLSADFGTGNELYAFGRFRFVDGASKPGFVKWNGTSWDLVGGGIVSGSAPTSGVAFNDGSGPAIFLAGDLMQVGGSPSWISGVFKWNGTAWTNVSAGIPTFNVTIVPFNGELWAYASAALYRWNGASWTLQASVPSPDYTSFTGVANNGSGDRFYFTVIDPAINNWGVSVFDFDGTAWTDHPEMGRFTMNFPSKVLGSNTNGDQSLWFLGTVGVGGELNPTTLETIDAMDSWSLSRWFCNTPPCSADFNSDTVVDFFDYLDFVDAFSSQLPSADFNGDSIIDFFDYLDFVDAFSLGC